MKEMKKMKKKIHHNSDLDFLKYIPSRMSTINHHELEILVTQDGPRALEYVKLNGGKLFRVFI